MSKPTLPNDGSVSEDPCQECNGRLVLRAVRSGGFFLGCSNFPIGCTFKMNPNTEQLDRLAGERLERQAIRAKEAAEKLVTERKDRKAAERRAASLAPQYCEGCFNVLSNRDVQDGREKHVEC